jgi:plasmid stability protein
LEVIEEEGAGNDLPASEVEAIRQIGQHRDNQVATVKIGAYQAALRLTQERFAAPEHQERYRQPSSRSASVYAIMCTLRGAVKDTGRVAPTAIQPSLAAAWGFVARKPEYWYYGRMKTTLDLPDDLMRAIKIRAAEENRKLKDTIADLLRRSLAQPPEAPPTARQRVRLPLVQCAHEARQGEEMTPERVAEVLIEEEAEGRRVAL